MTALRYAIVIEQAGHNRAAWVPDLPGCVATGDTIAEVAANMRCAIEMHVAGLRDDGEVVPAPSSAVGYVEISG